LSQELDLRRELMLTFGYLIQYAGAFVALGCIHIDLEQCERMHIILGKRLRKPLLYLRLQVCNNKRLSLGGYKLTCIVTCNNKTTYSISKGNETLDNDSRLSSGGYKLSRSSIDREGVLYPDSE